MHASAKWCVIYNPVAARDRARQRVQELQEVFGPEAEFWPTERAGHAEELAFEAAMQGFSVVAAAGGDGTVHEVANGLLRANRSETLFAVLPLGSANDYAYSLGIPNGWQPDEHDPRETREVDAGVVRADNGRERYFVNTLGLGFSGAVAIESRHIRRLQGLMLYGLALLKALWRRFQRPNMTCTFDDTTRSSPTLSVTIAIGRREGSFVVAPYACLDDGLFDYLQAGPLSRWEVLRYMPRMASGKQLPTDHPAIWQGRCREVRLVSEAPLTVHLDGEFFCLPEDGVRSLDIRILPGAFRVLATPEFAPCNA